MHLWCVLSLYMYAVFYLQDRALYCACYFANVVRAQELLLLGSNINYHHDGMVSYSAHIHMHMTYSGCVGYQCTVQ